MESSVRNSRRRTLVDGCIVNNVPVDIVRQMGADIVIAVDLGASLDTRQVESFTP